MDESVSLDDTILVLARSYRSQHQGDARTQSRARADECRANKDPDGVYVWSCVGQVIHKMDELELPRDPAEVSIDDLRLALNVDSRRSLPGL